MLRSKQKLGKYRIVQKLAVGGFATVYKAYDTIEGIHLALKIPHAHLLKPEVLQDFRREVRLATRLDSIHILPVKDASTIDGHFVVAFPLGQETLDDRLKRRISLSMALDFAEQMLEAVAHAHRHRIIHCDIKPDNFILFDSNRLRLTDFGVAKVAMRTIKASGSGTIGYIAPEQAMGQPSLRSDVFSLGLVIYRMLSGHLPEWPYQWPLPGLDRLRQRVSDAVVEFLGRAIQVNPRKRFRDADQMLEAFKKVKPRAIKGSHRRKPPKRKRTSGWQEVRRKQFQQQFGRALRTRFACHRCGEPVSEPMQHCPWCGVRRDRHHDRTDFPARCGRCKRGIKHDWSYCAWCFGAALQDASNRSYSDVRYEARCSYADCRGELMAFMRYCPWCRRKVKRKWKLPVGEARCPSCGWGVAAHFWSHCPWCGKKLG